MKKLKILCLCLSLLFFSSFFVSCKTKKPIYSADSMEFTVAEKIEEIDEKNSSSLDDEVIKALAVIIRTKLVNGENLTALDDDYYCQNSCSENENLKTETASSENSLSKNYNEYYYKNSESESASIKNNFSESNFINSSSVNLNDKFSNASMEKSRTETFENENALTENSSNETTLKENLSNQNALTENSSSNNGSVNANKNNDSVNFQDSSDFQNLRFKHIYNLVKQTAGKILVKSSSSNLKTTNSNSAKNLNENSNSSNNTLSTNSQNENDDRINGNIDDNISKNSNSNGERVSNSQNLNESNLQENGESSTQENCSVNYTFDRQNFCWSKTIAKSSILKFLNKKNISLANISNIKPVYDENNSLKELSFASKNIPFSEIKENFDLNSSFITGLDNNLSSIIISGKSVDDGNVFDIFEAQKNAHLGQNFKQLLNNFFDGFILKTF